MQDSMTQIFAADGAAGGGIMSMLLMFGAMFAILYFIMIRPQQKQAKKQQALLASLKKGDEVVLTSGIFGKIYLVEDKYLTLEIGDKVRFKVLKQAVSGLISADGVPSVESQTKNS